MLSKSDVPVNKILSIFSSFQIEVCLLVPTETAMKKSIMDATKIVRDYFISKKIHNFSKQQKGPENKVLVDAKFINLDHEIKTKISLYRPKTKDGDPRIWVYDLKKYANPNNLLALFVFDGKIQIVNCSNEQILHSYKNPIF